MLFLVLFFCSALAEQAAAPRNIVLFIGDGMGFEQAGVDQKRCDDPVLARQYFEENAGMTRKFLRGLPSNRQLIDHLVKHGIYKI